MFKEQNVEGRGVGKFKRAIITCTIIAVSSVRMSSVSLDVGSDVALLYQYSNNSLNETKFPMNCKCTESNVSKILGKMNSNGSDIFWDEFKISSIDCFQTHGHNTPRLMMFPKDNLSPLKYCSKNHWVLKWSWIRYINLNRPVCIRIVIYCCYLRIWQLFSSQQYGQSPGQICGHWLIRLLS